MKNANLIPLKFCCGGHLSGDDCLRLALGTGGREAAASTKLKTTI